MNIFGKNKTLSAFIKLVKRVVVVNKKAREIETPTLIINKTAPDTPCDVIVSSAGNVSGPKCT